MTTTHYAAFDHYVQRLTTKRIQRLTTLYATFDHYVQRLTTIHAQAALFEAEAKAVEDMRAKGQAAAGQV